MNGDYTLSKMTLRTTAPAHHQRLKAMLMPETATEASGFVGVVSKWSVPDGALLAETQVLRTAGHLGICPDGQHIATGGISRNTAFSNCWPADHDPLGTNWVLSDVRRLILDNSLTMAALTGIRHAFPSHLDAMMQRSTIHTTLRSRADAFRICLLCSISISTSLLAANGQAADSDKREKPAPGEIVGLVVDGKGTPIAEATVDVWTSYPGNETKTDAKGRFRLKAGDGDNRVEVRVSKPGYSPYYQPQHQTGSAEFTFILESGTYIEGQILDLGGKPVPNATVNGKHGPHRGDGVLIGDVTTVTKSDTSGKYRMYVCPETYDVQVSVPGVGVARIEGVLAAKNKPKTLDIQLNKGVRFEAIVLDHANNKPVENFVLWSWQQQGVVGKSDTEGRIVIEGMLPGESEFNVGYGKPTKMRGMTVYRSGILGRWWSPDATVEWQDRTIENNGWQRNFDDLTFDLVAGMDPVTIFAERGVVFSGKVLDPDGNVVAGATVAPAKSGSGNSLTGDTRYSVTSSKDGSYRVVMPAGNTFAYNLIVHDGKYSQWRNWANGVTKPFESAPSQKFVNFDMKLTRPCTVKGRVISSSGGDVKGIKVSSQATNMFVNRYYDPTTKAKEDGSFELRFVRPGEHTIRTEPFHFRAQDGIPGSWRAVDLKEGEILEDIELRIE